VKDGMAGSGSDKGLRGSYDIRLTLERTVFKGGGDRENAGAHACWTYDDVAVMEV